MTENPKVSIVVPIYKVEKYLEQCIDSILAQTLNDIEIILVDDGSPDRCPEIIDEYAKNDKRIVAIHQENGGYGVAVNHGIAIARGEYIGIIESDDWIEPNMYEKLYKKAKEDDSDVVKCGFFVYDSTKPKEKQNKKYKYNPRQNIEAWPDKCFTASEYPLCVSMHASIWAALYKSDFVKNIKLIETKSASYQDFPFLIETMCTAKRISVVKEYLVHWRVEATNNSSTNNFGEKTMVMADQCKICFDLLNKYGYAEAFKEEFWAHAADANYGFFSKIKWQYKNIYFDKLRELFNNIKNYDKFQYKYFNKTLSNFVKCVLNDDFIGATKRRSRFCLANIRRMFISIRFPSSSFEGWRIQLLGIQIGSNLDFFIPAFLRIRL